MCASDLPPSTPTDTSLDDKVPPYASLTPDCVIDAVEAAGYHCDARIFPLNSYENRVYQVGVEDKEPLIAKFYRPERWTDEQIEEEHHFSWQLQNQGLSVVAPLRNSDEKTLHEHAGFRFALYPRRGGHAPELENFDHLLSIGRTLGRIHALGAVKPFQYRPTLNSQTFGHDSREFLLQNDCLPKDLRPAYETLTHDLLNLVDPLLNKSEHNSIRLHGDCHPGNILWRDEPHFVDLDDARMGPAIQDLWMLLSGERQQQLAQLSELAEGYNEFFDLNPAELRLIEALRTLRLMHYSAWLARRWHDPTFPMNFPWFNTERYWAEHILELREQFSALQEPPLELF